MMIFFLGDNQSRCYCETNVLVPSHLKHVWGSDDCELIVVVKIVATPVKSCFKHNFWMFIALQVGVSSCIKG